jgi:hypothetical protein
MRSFIILLFTKYYYNDQSRRVRMVGHVVHIEKVSSSYTSSVENRRDPLEELGIDGKVFLNSGVWTGLLYLLVYNMQYEVHEISTEFIFSLREGSLLTAKFVLTF